MARHWSPDPTFTVLFVCTGNICRSALAERLSRAYLDDALGADASTVVLRSAGTQAVVGSGVHRKTALVLAGLGGDPTGFSARQLLDDMAIDADLTLTLTRAHRRAVLSAAPRALSRTFTLREAADLVGLVDRDGPLPGKTSADRCRALVKQLSGVRARRTSGSADDVPDPIGQPLDVHQHVGELIAKSLIPILDRLVSAHDASRRSAVTRS
ncbi:arsenate reductase/protein-tyrosine-phosphatase family protein [Modestobacter sp. URMC 112]